MEIPDPIPYDPQQVPQLIPADPEIEPEYPGAGAAEIRGIAE
ncbi:MAG: hypothetical protein ACLUQ6_01960 [Alistipes onderdonkii]